MTRHVEHCMGTAFTIDVRDPGDWSLAVREVVTWLRYVDVIFSTYRADSDINRIRRGELAVADAAPDVAVVLDLCARAQVATGGYFTSLHHGAVDPTGLVKGWAIERASALLRDRGSVNHAVNGGGDMQLAGESGPGRPWTVGITDPHDRTRVLTTVTGRDLAVATSGIAERGAHIVDPFTGRAAVELASVTVVGPSLTDADVYATAACAMGRAARAWLDGVAGYDALLVGADRSVSQTSVWHRHAAVA